MSTSANLQSPCVAARQPEAVARLCPACGLCCNGVLFADVELQSDDDAGRLAALGMKLLRKGRKPGFAQPCACFDGKWCRIYAERPVRCRTFQCRLLQRAQSGQITLAAALLAIQEVRHCAETVRRLVAELGQRDECAPLSRRYAEVMGEPINLADADERIGRRSELLLAVHRLTKILERDFLT